VAVTGLFVMLAGYQYLSAGGSVRAVESAKSSLYGALIGFAVVIMCEVIAGLVGGALGAPRAGHTTMGMVLAPARGCCRCDLAVVSSYDRLGVPSASFNR
jgi:hypothetical protein